MGAYILTKNIVPLSTIDQNDPEQLVEFPTYGLPTLDAHANTFFLNELRFIIPEMVEFEYAEISARRVLPIDRRAGPGAQTIEFRQVTTVGQAKVVTDYADDVPKANVFAEAFSQKIRSLACEATWSMQEIRANALASTQGNPVSIDRESSDGAREAILRLENDLAWAGSTKHGLIGVINAPNVPTTVAASGVWSSNNAQEIVDDLNFMVNEIVENSNQVERPDTILLPVEQYHIAINKNMGLGTDTTALQYFVNNSPYIASMDNVVPINELAGAGAGGVDIAIAYRSDSSKLQLNVPFDVESLAPEVRGMTTTVTYHSRFGGVTVKKPLSMHILTTI